MTTLTAADFNGWRFMRDAVHFNGGSVFFGYGHRCVDQPRLLVIDKYFKKDRSTQLPPDSWSRPKPRGPYLPLAEMGFVEWGRDLDGNVTCRLTEAGRSVAHPTAKRNA